MIPVTPKDISYGMKVASLLLKAGATDMRHPDTVPFCFSQIKTLRIILSGFCDNCCLSKPVIAVALDDGGAAAAPTPLGCCVHQQPLFTHIHTHQQSGKHKIAQDIKDVQIIFLNLNRVSIFQMC